MAVEDNKTGRATILPARRGPHPEDRGGQQPDRPSAWSSEQRLSWMRDGMEVKLYEGREDLEVVGEASYQDNLWRIIRESVALPMGVCVKRCTRSWRPSLTTPMTPTPWRYGLRA